MPDRSPDGYRGLRLSNTLTREKQDFVPIDTSNVRMYVCGPTVYDYAHIGNARPLIVFDVLFRLLRHLYGETNVTYVRNITDVDDKINARAAEEYPDLPLNEAIRKVTEKTEHQFHDDASALGCLPPTHEPRATEHIGGMIEMIRQLVEQGHAYEAEGHVLFDVRSWKKADGTLEYGQLANRSLDDMIAGARVEVAPYKRDPMDFVLWKPSNQEAGSAGGATGTDRKGEPAWESPWGPGRPGWHLECSVMAGRYLGDTFDIHGGGVDLVFPHHENEIAQSRCAHGTDVMANYWLHNGYLQVEGEKMSKSLGNFITIRDLLDGGSGRRPWPGEVARLTLLATHYRQPLDFTEAKLAYWRRKLVHWVESFVLFGTQAYREAFFTGAKAIPSEELVTALNDDLNFQKAIVHFDRLASAAVQQDSDAANSLGGDLIWLGLARNAYVDAYEPHPHGGARSDLLGKYADVLDDARAIVLNHYKFYTTDAAERHRSLADVTATINARFPELAADGVRIAVSEFATVSLEPTGSASAINSDLISRRISARLAARKAKDFSEADRIRGELEAMGIQLMDRKDPTTGEVTTEWEVKR